ncbi:HK97 family phage prohead protease [Niallia sp. 03091]|uniref:HK97 family phage prohead protease n=1 Tax=Niallia sp. 03091 TaxID=3458059 RepID=UPI004043E9A2
MDKAKKEMRQIQTKIELRNAEGEDGQQVIEGYALKFNRQSDVLGYYVKFREKIDPRALDNTDMSNVVALFNHNENQVLARNTVSSGKGSLSLTVDNIGLRFQFIPTDTSYARDLLENVRSGVINQCSFAFSLTDDDDADEIEYVEETNMYSRTIKRIGALYDVSVVTTPAYPDTEAVVGSRNLDNIVTRKKELMQIELDLMTMEQL